MAQKRAPSRSWWSSLSSLVPARLRRSPAPFSLFWTRSMVFVSSPGMYELAHTTKLNAATFLVTVVVVVVASSASTLPCPVPTFSGSLSRPRSTLLVDPGWFRVLGLAPLRSSSSSSSSSFPVHLVRLWSLPGFVGPSLVHLGPPVMARSG
jgi:hypothetical protein